MRLWRNWQTRYFEGVVFTRRMGSSPINRTILKRYRYGKPQRFFVAFFRRKCRLILSVGIVDVRARDDGIIGEEGGDFAADSL